MVRARRGARIGGLTALAHRLPEPADARPWPPVRAPSGWPETNEDAMRELATAWQGAGGKFTDAHRNRGAGSRGQRIRPAAHRVRRRRTAGGTG
ncbi:WXG100-like domain-containing protein [Crossiella cryophila]